MITFSAPRKGGRNWGTKMADQASTATRRDLEAKMLHLSSATSRTKGSPVLSGVLYIVTRIVSCGMSATLQKDW
jgi:hypothetical protein